MPELHGAQLPIDGLHVAIRYDVADQAERDALVLVPTDVGAFLLQRDVLSIFALVSVTPVTWTQFADGATTLAAILALNAEVLERVTGPIASNDNAVARFDGTSGTLIEDSLVSIDDAGNISTPGTVNGVNVSDFQAASFVTSSADPTLPNERVLTAGAGISLTPGAGTLTIANTAAGASAVQGPAGATDTAIALFDGSTGKLIKESLVRIDNLGNIVTGGTVDGVDISNLAMALALVAVPDYVTLSSTPTLGNERTLTAGAGITITDDGPGGAVTVTSTGGAPVGASYVTLGANATLSSERVLTAGANITITDGGAGGPVTIASAAAGAPTDAEYLVSATHAGLSAERVLTAGANITLTPGAGTLTVASTATGGAPSTAQYLLLSIAGTLPNARQLLAGTGVSFTDGGPGDTLLVDTPNAVQCPTSAVDNALTRWDGTTGKLVQSSTATLSDAGALATASLSISGNIAVTGTVDGVDVGNLGAVPFVTIGASAAVANERALTAGPGISITDGGAGGAVTVATTGAPGVPPVRIMNADGNLLATDAWGSVIFNGATINATLQPNATIAMAVGTRIELFSFGGNGYNLICGSGVTVNGASTTLSGSGSFKVRTLVKYAANDWIMDNGT